MRLSGSLVWLASYPKSGNTWLRLLLRTLKGGDESTLSINQPREEFIASCWELTQRATGCISSELSDDEADSLRCFSYRFAASMDSRMVVMKTHDSFDSMAISSKGFPVEMTKAVIYLVRNPLDIVPSLAHHCGMTFDDAIQYMNDPKALLSDRNTRQFRQLLGTWSEHVMGWTRQTQIPVLIVRYEDLARDSIMQLRRIADAIGLRSSEEGIRNAVYQCNFDRLRKAEGLHGFSERSATDREFFRRGKSGSWRRELRSEQIESVTTSHCQVMDSLGYSIVGDDARKSV